MARIKPFLLATTLLLLSACGTIPNPNGTKAAEAEGTLKIGGSSETLVVLERLSTAYQAQTEGVKIQIFSPSQTSTGIQGVKDQVLDIGAVSRVITPEEREELKLQYISLTQTPLVFVVHETVTGVDNLTSEQIYAIYQGTITNWQAVGGPDADIMLFDFVEDENEKKILRQHYLGSELEITPNAIVFTEEDELVDMAALTPYSFAAIPLDEELEELPIKILSVNGVKPSSETLANSSYQGAIDLGVVTLSQPSGVTADFLNFARSAAGQTLIAGEESE